MLMVEMPNLVAYMRQEECEYLFLSFFFDENFIYLTIINRTGEGGFLYAENMKSLQIHRGIISGMTSSGSGSALEISNSEKVNITSLSIQSCTSTGPNAYGNWKYCFPEFKVLTIILGSIYLNTIAYSYLNGLTFSQNKVTGYGVRKFQL